MRDEIDRLDALYACLSNQVANRYQLNELLRNRFFNLPTVEEFKKFEQNEYQRISEAKRVERLRVPFIPNILPFQRVCPDRNLKDLKWIREHLC